MTNRVLSPLRVARELMRERARSDDERRKWTERGVAAACGLDQSQLSRIETLRARCKPGQAERIAKIFPRGVLTETQLLFPERYMRGDAEAAHEPAPRRRRSAPPAPSPAPGPTPTPAPAPGAKPRRAGKAAARAVLTVDEFCERYRIQRGTFYRMKRDGTAPPFMRVGQRILIFADTLATWKRERARAGTQTDATAAA